MSQWTHVNCIIRLDGASGLLPDPDTRLLDLPEGSEGGLNSHMWVNPYSSSMARYTLSVFGDLRDFGEKEAKELDEWFTKVCGLKNNMIRNAVLEVRVEYGIHYTLCCQESSFDKECYIHKCVIPNKPRKGKKTK